MLFQAKNASVLVDGAQMDYVRFGRGKQVLILLPGLGDGLHTVKGTALAMAWMYREFVKDYTVYVFSRRQNLPAGWTTRDMARDQKAAMDALGIRKAQVIGVSMGGMIAQHLAADYPETVEKLVLLVTAPMSNHILSQSIMEWVDLAQRDDHAALMDSNVRKIYSDAYYRHHKWLIPVMGVLTKPRSYDRFFVQAEACRTHNAWEKLTQLQLPTLVIGGEKDQVLGGDPFRLLAERIPDAQLRMYPQWGHGLYEEEPTLNRTLLTFLQGELQ